MRQAMISGTRSRSHPSTSADGVASATVGTYRCCVKLRATP